MSFSSRQEHEEGSMGATEPAPGERKVQVDKVPADVPGLEPGQWLSNLSIFVLV